MPSIDEPITFDNLNDEGGEGSTDNVGADTVDPNSVGMDDIDLNDDGKEINGNDIPDLNDDKEPTDGADDGVGADADDVDSLGDSVDPIGDSVFEDDQQQQVDIEPPKWVDIETTKNRFQSEHQDKFILKASRLSAKQGDKTKWVAKLVLNNKIIDDGIVWVDNNIDAKQFIQNKADRLIERFNSIN